MASPEVLKSLLTGEPNPDDLLSEILPTMRWVHIGPVTSPTKGQIEALRTFAPYTSQNLLQTRKALTEGTARVGPFPEDVARNLAASVFGPHGMAWCVVVATVEELKQEGLAI